jgi:hypothetical protein
MAAAQLAEPCRPFALAIRIPAPMWPISISSGSRASQLSVQVWAACSTASWAGATAKQLIVNGCPYRTEAAVAVSDLLF